MSGNKFRNIFSGINREFLGSVLNSNPNSNNDNSNTSNTNNSLNIDGGSINSQYDKDRTSSFASSTTSSNATNEAEGFICPVCFAAFPNGDILKEHFSSEHSTFNQETDSFVLCKHCKMKCSDNDELSIHMEKYHSNNDKNGKKISENEKSGPIIAQLDQSTTKHLTETFSQVLQTTFNNNRSTTAKNNSDSSNLSFITLEEFELFKNQQKSLEETKDLLLNELNKKDQFIEKFEKEFRDERQLLITQLNESSEREKSLVNLSNIAKAEVSAKDEQLNNLKNDFDKLKLENKTNKTLIEKIENEKLAIKTHSEKLQQEFDSKLSQIQKINSNIKQENCSLNEKMQKLQSELDSKIHSNNDLQMQIKCLQAKNQDEYTEQYKQIEELRKKQLEDFHKKFQGLENKQLRQNLNNRENIKRILEKLGNEKLILNELKEQLKQNIVIIQKDKNEIIRMFEDGINHSVEIFNNTNTLIDEKIKTSEQMKQMKINHKNSIQKLLDDINNTKALLKEKDELIENLNLEKHGLIDEKIQISKQMEQMKSYHENSIQKLLDDINNNKALLKEKDEIIDNLNLEKQGLMVEIRSNIEKLNSCQKENVDYCQKLNQILNHFQLFRNAINNLKSKFDCLKIYHNNLVNDVSTKLSEERFRYDEYYIPNIISTIEKLKEPFNRLNKDNKKLKSDIDSLKRDILPKKEEQIQKLLQSNEVFRNNIKNKLETFKNIIEKTQNGIKEQKIQMENLSIFKQNWLVEYEKEKARLAEVLQYHYTFLDEMLKLFELEKLNYKEEKRSILERCVAAEENFDKMKSKFSDLKKKFNENEKAVHELGMQNQTLQIKLDEANQKLRRSWTDDRLVDKCMNEQCQRQFTTVIRKHHCRSCGNIFCNECSTKQTQMTGHPKPVRVCDSCYQELNQP